MAKTKTVRVAQGLAEGLSEASVLSFYSLPYAAPMTNERRFRAPAPAESWSGVRDACRAGASAPQNPRPASDIDVGPLIGYVPGLDPDYLTLNVFAPEQAKGAPVMVFVHGGSFISGSKDAAVYDGRAFARDGVVCVVINYRLGVEGFLPLEGGATNLGLRDIIAALHWVGDNIAVFGGDSGNVTMFGESGGAFCIAALMTSPLAQGLFQRAICQSGHVHVSRDLALMQRLASHGANRLGVEPTRNGFLSVPIEQVLAAQAWMMEPAGRINMRDKDGRDPSFGLTSFLPVHGDDVLPLPSLDAFRAGQGAVVDLLMSTNLEEANIFFVPGGLRDLLTQEAALAFLSAALPDGYGALATYGLGEQGAKPGYVLCAALTDLMFRAPVRNMAEWHRGRAWVCEFDWRSPALDHGFGAAHAIELPFVFDTLEAAGGDRSVLGPSPPQALADHIHRLWVEFAKTGVAPWPRFSAEDRQVYSPTKQAAAREAVLPAAAFLPR